MIQDWRRHKVHCRPGADPDPSVTDALAEIEPSEEMLADDDESALGSFEVLTDLWEVCDIRVTGLEGKKQKRHAEVAVNALAYVCAAQGCGVEATRKSALSRCAGLCALLAKPSYCSKECRKRACIPDC